MISVEINGGIMVDIDIWKSMGNPFVGYIYIYIHIHIYIYNMEIAVVMVNIIYIYIYF